MKPLSYNEKSRVVYEYLHRYSIETFVETGTYEGAGVVTALQQVEEAFSIELDEQRFKKAQALFAPLSGVHIIHGDSGEVLPEIIPKIKGRCLFWLDAHILEGHKDTPILDELKCVLDYQGEYVLLIDDARLYTGEGDWPAFDNIKAIILKARPDCEIEVKDDIIRCIPDGIEAVGEDGFISMSSLGNYGRFGNQLFQYAALKIYAKKYGLRPEIPQGWLGRKIFIGCNDLTLSDRPRDLITVGKDCIWLNGRMKRCDIKGYFQYHTSLYAQYKDYFRSLFNFTPSLEKVLNSSIAPLKNTVVGIHIRLTDYNLPGRRANIASIQWYLDWLEENWKKLDNPVLFIASDDIGNVVGHFAEYTPHAFASEAEFLYDFYALCNCDYLLISNSTFSFTAAMLNVKGKEFYRPDFRAKKLISFEPWNAAPLLEPVG